MKKIPEGLLYLPVCFVGSTSTYPAHGSGVGGSGLPFTAVTSGLPWVPPLGHTCWYCPDLGAGVPGVKTVLVILLSNRDKNTLRQLAYIELL